MDEYTTIYYSLMDDVLRGISINNKNTILEKLDKLFRMAFGKNKKRLICKLICAINQSGEFFTSQQTFSILKAIEKLQMKITADDVEKVMNDLLDNGFSIFPEIDFPDINEYFR